MPSDSEKNAWPMAEVNVPPSTLLQSGTRKKRRPSPAPGSDTDRAIKTSSSTKSTGINSLDARSMPLPMPPSTTITVAIMNRPASSTGVAPPLINALNFAPMLSASPLMRLPSSMKPM